MVWDCDPSCQTLKKPEASPLYKRLPSRGHRHSMRCCLVNALQHPLELPCLRPVEPDRSVRASCY